MAVEDKEDCGVIDSCLVLHLFSSAVFHLNNEVNSGDNIFGVEKNGLYGVNTKGSKTIEMGFIDSGSGWANRFYRGRQSEGHSTGAIRKKGAEVC